jgi:UDP-4-amino-4,6-dideoxy-N-acetyl-beta-L-altrosamine N-acetyltransferase
MDDEVTKYMYTNPKLDMGKQLLWYEKIKSSSTEKYWLIIIDDTPIGVLSIMDIDETNKRCSWAYYIGDTSFRGRGIARTLECNIYDYVFDFLGMNKLCCEVFTFNEKVISIHEKFGSEIEGTLRQHIFKNGDFHDIVKMAITREKWCKIKSHYNYDKITIED